jgi:prephenate dehydratase
MTVAIQGQPGSFSEAAATILARGSAIEHCDSFDALFSAVAEGRARCGVVPVHNSIAGDVCGNAGRVRQPGFRIVADLLMPVRQCLIVRSPMDVNAIRRVASHPVALRQCSRFFAADPRRVPVAIADTGSAVRDLMHGTLDADAAIGSRDAAIRYRATVLIEGVDDDPSNATTFLLFVAQASGG